jgi:putative colanic acid biosynthesis UDP-glucose lipid carrier transferase
MVFGPMVLPMLDMIGVSLSFLLAYTLVLDFPVPGFYLVPLVIALLFVPFVFDAFGLYRAWRGDSLPRELIRVLAAWISFLIGLLILSALTKGTAFYSRIWALTWLSCGAIWLLGSRIVLRTALGQLRAKGWNLKQVILVGDAPMLVRLVSSLRENPGAGFAISGYVSVDPYELPELKDLHYLGGQPTLAQLVEGPYRTIDEIWLAFAPDGRNQLRSTLEQLSLCSAAIRVVPDLLSIELINAAPSQVAGIPMLDLNRSPIFGLSRLAKGLMDRVLSLIAVIVLAPLMLLIAVGIRLSSSGPIVFRQSRHGLRGEIFEIYKFRTMHEHGETDGQVTQARRDDQRVFSFGRLLRRTSMDELPQLFNVLSGQMSLVGPRPHAEAHNRYYQNIIDRYMWRHAVKPGMTGWAQVHGLRGEIDSVDKMERRLEYDLYYIQNWSLWLDIEIMVLTIFRGLLNRNAY